MALCHDITSFNDGEIDWVATISSAAGSLLSFDGGVDPGGVDFDGLEGGVGVW